MPLAVPVHVPPQLDAVTVQVPRHVGPRRLVLDLADLDADTADPAVLLFLAPSGPDRLDLVDHRQAAAANERAQARTNGVSVRYRVSTAAERWPSPQEQSL